MDAVGVQVVVTCRGAVVTYPTYMGTVAAAVTEAELSARLAGLEVVSSEAHVVAIRGLDKRV